MGKHRITRKQMKKDEFVSTVTKITMYVEEHWKYFAYGGGIIAAIALIFYLGIYFSEYRSEKASSILNTGLEVFHAPVATGSDSRTPSSVKSFATDSERYREALKSFEMVLSRYPRTKAGHLALYYSGLCQMDLGNYDEAIKRLDEFVQSGADPFVLDIARSSLAQCYFYKKDFDASARIWKQISEESKTLFPRDEALMNLARSFESQGKSSEAKEIYRRISQEYPGTRSSQEAASRLQS